MIQFCTLAQVLQKGSCLHQIVCTKCHAVHLKGWYNCRETNYNRACMNNAINGKGH